MEKLSSAQWEAIVAVTLAKLEFVTTENETLHRDCAEYRNTIYRLENRVEDLQSQLPSQSTVQTNPESNPAVKEAMDKLRAEIADPRHTGGYSFIDTIKVVRAATNWGLKEAKDWTEKYSGYKARY